MKRNNKRNAFTIVELVIVIAVIAILATVLVPTFGDVISSAKESAAKQGAKNAYTKYLVENNGSAPEVLVYKHANGKVVALENGAAVNVYDTEAEFFTAYNLNAFEMTAGELYSELQEHVHHYTVSDDGKGYLTYICTCGYRYVEKKEFKLLMVGNSLTNDAANREQGMTQSQLLDILQAMLGNDVEITIGVIFNGGRSLSWYATQTEQKNKFKLGVISTQNNTWGSAGSLTVEEAFEWTDWDVISLQPYDVDVNTGNEKLHYPDETAEKFIPLDVASKYMLDRVAECAPDAAVYCYMQWATGNAIQLNAQLAKYNKNAAIYPSVLDYAGTESGKQFKDIVPVGLSVQNARTTYLALLSYNTGAENLNLNTDPQFGLMRDYVHLSFNIGRYIAALTFAETLIPEEMRVEGYELPEIRITESVGKLPKEYTEIAQKSVLAAVESWRNGSLNVTDIVGYTEDPSVAARQMMGSLVLNLAGGDADALSWQIRAAVLETLPDDFAVDMVEVDVDAHSALVTIRFGYTSVVVTMDYMIVNSADIS